MDDTDKVARYTEFRMSTNHPVHDISSDGVIYDFIHKGVCFNTKPVEISHDLMKSSKVRVWRMTAALTQSDSRTGSYFARTKLDAVVHVMEEDVTGQYLAGAIAAVAAPAAVATATLATATVF